MAARDIIIKPLLSEKSYAGIQNKKYSFIVAKNANKTLEKKYLVNIIVLSTASRNSSVGRARD